MEAVETDAEANSVAPSAVAYDIKFEVNVPSLTAVAIEATKVAYTVLAVSVGETAVVAT